jgi:hypothetical protein
MKANHQVKEFANEAAERAAFADFKIKLQTADAKNAEHVSQY